MSALLNMNQSKYNKGLWLFLYVVIFTEASFLVYFFGKAFKILSI